jgi:hypothetical protein
MSGKWVGAKAYEGQMLKCKCGNRAFLVIKQPVARKVKSKSSHRKRIVGVCPACTQVTRIKLGGPN